MTRGDRILTILGYLVIGLWFAIWLLERFL
jgi:hypothetical protein